MLPAWVVLENFCGLSAYHWYIMSLTFVPAMAGTLKYSVIQGCSGIPESGVGFAGLL
jgi:hypothetical protein